MVRLEPSETHALLDPDQPPEPVLDADEQVLASALAAGNTTDAIARRLGVTRRSAQRRIAQLRDRLSARSTEELIAELARRGY